MLAATLIGRSHSGRPGLRSKDRRGGSPNSAPQLASHRETINQKVGAKSTASFIDCFAGALCFREFEKLTKALYASFDPGKPQCMPKGRLVRCNNRNAKVLF